MLCEKIVIIIDQNYFCIPKIRLFLLFFFNYPYFYIPIILLTQPINISLNTFVMQLSDVNNNTLVSSHFIHLEM